MDVYFGYPGIDIAVADKGVVVRIPCDVGHLPKRSVHWGQRRIGMLERLSSFVGSLLFAAEQHHDPARRIELDDHVRTLVRGPNVVMPVDSDGVGERPRVQVVADFANERAIGAELQKLRGGRGVRRSGGIAAREYKNMSL